MGQLISIFIKVKPQLWTWVSCLELVLKATRCLPTVLHCIIIVKFTWETSQTPWKWRCRAVVVRRFTPAGSGLTSLLDTLKAVSIEYFPPQFNLVSVWYKFNQRRLKDHGWVFSSFSVKLWTPEGRNMSLHVHNSIHDEVVLLLLNSPFYCHYPCDPSR